MRIVNFSLVIALVVFITSCLKNTPQEPCTPKTVESETPVMTKYATDSTITTTKDNSGLLYEIIDAGTGATPGLQNTVTVKYIGRTMDGVRFDENVTESKTFVLGQLIKAWQIALPKIKAGGKIKIITPSSLAYPCNPNVPVSINNQPLYFYIELISVS